MAADIVISVDAMGGDHGPAALLPGLEMVRVRRPDLRFMLFGAEDRIRPVLDGIPALKGASAVHHCDYAVRMDEKPSQALRAGRRRSSMWRAIEAVRDRQASVAVSAGNTGALMAMAKICLKSQQGIERPAIAAIWPTIRGESVVLDVGATIGADARQLVDFAVMGAAMASTVFGIDRPTVGLLNIGVEEVKGLDQVKEAGALLREMNLPSMDYRGFIEGDDLGRGTVDVAVTEGFSGNIALKTAEGTARQIADYLRTAMRRTLLARLGYVLAGGAFRRLREKMDPNKANGGVFLGLGGLVIKSHGGSGPEGFASAVELADDMVRNGLEARIAASVALYRNGRIPAPEHVGAS